MDRAACTAAILAAKADRDLTFAELAAKVGRHEVWTTSAIFGQAQMAPEEAAALTERLGLGEQVAASLCTHPTKGSLE